jgi:hypothetical protein
MPVQIGVRIPQPEQPTADIIPDQNPIPPMQDAPSAVLHSQMWPWSMPYNFNELSPEEQKHIMDRYRFQPLRLRSDIKDRTIPLTRKTLDIP